MILVDKNTPVICQGITSEQGAMHTEIALAYGTHFVAGTGLNATRKEFLNLPLFSTIKEAVSYSKAHVSVIYATPSKALKEVKEALDAKIKTIVCVSERVALQDAIEMEKQAIKHKALLLGPASVGFIIPGECMLGIMPTHLFQKGHVGIISRSSSLMYESVYQLKEKNIGISFASGLGGPIALCSFVPLIKLLLQDKNTKAILIIGEEQGLYEYELAEYLKTIQLEKPIFALIVGQNWKNVSKNPLLGFIPQNPAFNIQNKIKALKESGVQILLKPESVGNELCAKLA